MVGISCGIIVILMTGNTLIRYFLITPIFMTFNTADSMTSGQREETVFKIGSGPAYSFYAMAVGAIG